MPAWECYDLLVQWPWSGRKSAEPTDLTLSVSDPLLAGYFSVGGTDYSGIVVSESNALALSAVWRSVSLISGTLASLPLRTLRDKGNGERERVGSIFDNPGERTVLRRSPGKRRRSRTCSYTETSSCSTCAMRPARWLRSSRSTRWV